jgi:hypothetical protein
MCSGNVGIIAGVGLGGGSGTGTGSVAGIGVGRMSGGIGVGSERVSGTVGGIKATTFGIGIGGRNAFSLSICACARAPCQHKPAAAMTAAGRVLTGVAGARAPLVGLPIALVNDAIRYVKWPHTGGEPRR